MDYTVFFRLNFNLYVLQMVHFSWIRQQLDCLMYQNREAYDCVYFISLKDVLVHVGIKTIHLPLAT